MSNTPPFDVTAAHLSTALDCELLVGSGMEDLVSFITSLCLGLTLWYTQSNVLNDTYLPFATTSGMCSPLLWCSYFVS